MNNENIKTKLSKYLNSISQVLLSLGSKMKRHKVFLIIGVLLIISLFGIRQIFFSPQNKVEKKQPVNVSQVKSSIVLNKEFTFPILNNNNKELGKLKYIILSAEYKDDILIRGRRVKAVQGKKILILNLKIINSQGQGVQIRSRDYVRLSINKDEWLAPELHNDPLEVQAISTKYTRIGFVVDEKNKLFTLQIGQINNKKQNVNINF